MHFSSLGFLYFLFFLSGAAGLMYEIVWSRLLILIFGSTTNSIVAVIAAFLGGLALGSLLFGKIADKMPPKNLIKTYSILEITVGITAGLTLFLLPLTKTVYALISDGSSVNLILLIAKFCLSIFVLVIPSTFMGATLPILARFVRLRKKPLEAGVSYLYAINTLGAAFGTLASAFVLIELIGLTNTIFVAMTINIFVGVLAHLIRAGKLSNTINDHTVGFLHILSSRNLFLIIAFSLSGLVAIAYEVLWTRILTPTVGTFVYAFAAILALYLLGIALGSLIYEKLSNLIRRKSSFFAICQFAIGFFALGSVYFMSNQIVLPRNLLVLLVILPATIFMGLTFPAIVALMEKQNHSGKVVGLSYFGNTMGSILGGFLASFLFLPLIGSTQSILLLTIVNFILAISFIINEGKANSVHMRIFAALILTLIIFTSWLFIFKRDSLYENTTQWRINWAKQKGIDYEFREDEVASVFGYRDRKVNDYNLFIDGVPTTGKIGETKLMAHIPIILHNNPQKVLIIAFGMGTTFRSSLTHNIKTDAIELVPSVPPLMYLFHSDAPEVLENPLGRVIINDGRNFVFLTSEKYDIVTIDPPPPFNAAGTTVLYSKNFYEEITMKLNPDGIVSQWIWFGSREDDIGMTIKSFIEVFPYVLALEIPHGSRGILLEGSFSPLAFNNQRIEQTTTNTKATADLREFYEDNFSWEKLPELIIGDRDTLEKVVGKYAKITDERPWTEYFILRHNLTDAKSLFGTEGESFTQKIKSNYQDIR